MGYAGGTTEAPTYHELGDHREAVRVAFDPAQITYDELLAAFWSGQPTDIPPDPNPRIHLGLLPLGPEQTQAARASIEAREGFFQPVYVDLLPDATFWPAERLHQKFYFQKAHRDLVDEWAREGDVDTILASRGVMLLNSQLDGSVGDEALEEAAAELGLDPEELRARLDEPVASAEPAGE